MSKIFFELGRNIFLTWQKYFCICLKYFLNLSEIFSVLVWNIFCTCLKYFLYLPEIFSVLAWNIFTTWQKYFWWSQAVWGIGVVRGVEEQLQDNIRFWHIRHRHANTLISAAANIISLQIPHHTPIFLNMSFLTILREFKWKTDLGFHQKVSRLFDLQFTFKYVLVSPL